MKDIEFENILSIAKIENQIKMQKLINQALATIGKSVRTHFEALWKRNQRVLLPKRLILCSASQQKTTILKWLVLSYFFELTILIWVLNRAYLFVFTLFFWDYRCTLCLLPLKMSYFNSPKPNLASPLKKKSIENCKSYVNPMNMSNSQNVTNVWNMQLSLHLRPAGCLNTALLFLLFTRWKCQSRKKSHIRPSARYLMSRNAWCAAWPVCVIGLAKCRCVLLSPTFRVHFPSFCSTHRNFDSVNNS